MDLVEFLRARLDEDEQLARAAIDDGPHWLADRHGIDQSADPGFTTCSGYFRQDRRPAANVHIAHWDPARVLAEVEAKRRIIDLDTCVACAIESQPCDHRDSTLRMLALPYADHPDYNPAWR